MSKRGILLSGGMDSTALAYWKRPEYAFTLDYGQRSANAEIIAAQQIASCLNIKHQILTVDCSSLGSGDLSDNKPIGIAPKSDWWPFRNQMLVTLCGMSAVKLGITELMLGAVKTDQYHNDSKEEFYNLLNQLMLFQEGNISVSTPAIGLTTAQLVKVSGIPPDTLLWAHSCHKSNIPCNNCRGCNKYFSILNEVSEYCE